MQIMFDRVVTGNITSKWYQCIEFIKMGKFLISLHINYKQKTEIANNHYKFLLKHKDKEERHIHIITKNKGCHLIENNYILQTKTDNVIYICHLFWRVLQISTSL